MLHHLLWSQLKKKKILFQASTCVPPSLPSPRLAACARWSRRVAQKSRREASAVIHDSEVKRFINISLGHQGQTHPPKAKDKWSGFPRHAGFRALPPLKPRKHRLPTITTGCWDQRASAEGGLTWSPVTKGTSQRISGRDLLISCWFG